MKKATHKPKRIIARWRPIAFAALLTFAVLAEFSTASHQPSPRPPDMLLGRWHSKPTQDELYAQFEFVQDGTVVERVLKSDTQRNVKEPPQLDQCATGTFRIIDPMRLEIEVGPLLERECPYWSAEPWDEKVRLERLYELDWLDDDHVRLRTGMVWPFGLRTGGETIELARFQPTRRVIETYTNLD